MTSRFSRLVLAGGQNVVPLSGWFRPAHDKEPFADYWRRSSRLEAEKHARDEEAPDL